jgi:cobyrinic acid a,c-diamide synthase
MQGRIVIAGLRGSAGKTALSLGLISAWQGRGIRVVPFKKGPDYIDAAWLSLAAGAACRTLDGWLMGTGPLLQAFGERAVEPGIAVIEGNRGLFDGLDAEGTYSTAALARLLDAPVVLAVDGSKTTRTAAALVLGCQRFEPELKLRGVILNRVAGARHEQLLRKCIEQECKIPVFGAVPELKGIELPERHLGLLPTAEHPQGRKVLTALREAAEKYLDLAGLQSLAESARPWKLESRSAAEPKSLQPPVRIGLFRDAAFQFYYPENLEQLVRGGAQLIELNALSDRALPELDALYLGGGFPETQAQALAQNETMRNSVREAAAAGLPIYAECGGALYLGESLTFQGHTYPMAGVLPIEYGFEKRPQGHGYTELKVEGQNPFYPAGTVLRGHEFHYSRVRRWQPETLSFAFRIQRGRGFGEGREGVCRLSVLATYSHVHALGCPEWAAGLVSRAGLFRREREDAKKGSKTLLASERIAGGREARLESGLAAKSGN